jgi:hypothetical protein
MVFAKMSALFLCVGTKREMDKAMQPQSCREKEGKENG